MKASKLTTIMSQIHPTLILSTYFDNSRLDVYLQEASPPKSCIRVHYLFPHPSFSSCPSCMTVANYIRVTMGRPTNVHTTDGIFVKKTQHDRDRKHSRKYIISFFIFSHFCNPDVCSSRFSLNNYEKKKQNKKMMTYFELRKAHKKPVLSLCSQFVPHCQH